MSELFTYRTAEEVAAESKHNDTPSASSTRA